MPKNETYLFKQAEARIESHFMGKRIEKALKKLTRDQSVVIYQKHGLDGSGEKSFVEVKNHLETYYGKYVCYSRILQIYQKGIWRLKQMSFLNN